MIELCRRRADDAGERLLYRFLLDGEVDGRQALLSYAELERRARAIGALLQSERLENERVLLLYPPGLDFITAFFGCLFAGAVAVPAYPPDHRRLERTLPRLRAIARDATASAVLTIGAFARLAPGLAETAPELAALRWFATDELAPGLETAWRAPDVVASTTAFLQYTSGSTGDPKGVVVSHANLLVNVAAIFDRLGFDAETIIVSWLPAYHDLGLVGAIVLPLFGGIPAVLLPPMAFLRRPLRWLQAISRFRGTASACPSFALDLCSTKVTREEVSTLDLRSWRVAVSGAEPIRAESLARFSERFAAAGFSREAHCPTYGLAESTLMVTAGRPGEPRALTVDKDALASGRVIASPAGRAVVGCGRAAAGHEVAIVDPRTRVLLGDVQVGEIWVRGPSVAQGYWHRPKETEEVFRAALAGTGAGPFLRTGDLGFLHEGEVFITGRLKDVILIGGTNHYPQDLEQTVERCHPQVRAGSVAAFPFDVRGEERVGVAAEVDAGRGAPVEEITAAILQALLGEHGLDAALVALLEPGALPKTASGKLQRRAARDQLLGGAPVLHRHEAPQAGSASVERGQQEILDFLCERFARALGLHADTIDPSRSVTDYGLGSLLLVETFTELGAWLGRTVDLELAFRATTLEALSRRLAAPAG